MWKGGFCLSFLATLVSQCNRSQSWVPMGLCSLNCLLPNSNKHTVPWLFVLFVKTDPDIPSQCARDTSKRQCRTQLALQVPRQACSKLALKDSTVSETLSLCLSKQHLFHKRFKSSCCWNPLWRDMWRTFSNVVPNVPLQIYIKTHTSAHLSNYLSWVVGWIECDRDKVGWGPLCFDLEICLIFWRQWTNYSLTVVVSFLFSGIFSFFFNLCLYGNTSVCSCVLPVHACLCVQADCVCVCTWQPHKPWKPNFP